MTTAPSTYFGFSDLSDGVTITPESRERLREEHDIVGMFLNLDKKSFDRIVDIGRKLREVISEEVPTAQANVHRLVQFEGFVNSKMELLPRHTFPNIYEVELRVGDYATHYPIVIVVAMTDDLNDLNNTISIGIDPELFLLNLLDH